MSTGASSPSQDQPGLFALNAKLLPIVSSFLALVVVTVTLWCVLTAVHRRKLRRIANDPRTIALARERARLREEAERGPPTPMMKTVNVEVDLEIGEGPQEWRHVMPLSLEFPSMPPPPYDGTKNATPQEAKYVRLTILVALPSASGRRHRKDDVILDATLADAEGRPIEAVDTIQEQWDHYHQFPETAIGIYQEQYKDEPL